MKQAGVSIAPQDLRERFSFTILRGTFVIITNFLVIFEVFMAVTTKNGVFLHIKHVAFVRTDVSEELSTSMIRVTRIGKLGTTLAVSSNRCTLRRNTKPF
jgi:hypothetical protein